MDELEWAEMGYDRVRLFNEDIEDWRGKKVLELGAARCLIGHLCRVEGVDCLSVDRRSHDGIGHWDVEAMEYMQSLVPFLEADAAKLPVADQSFDIVISDGGPPAVGTLAMREVRAIVGEVRRVLRPGGRFLMHPSGLATKFMVPIRMDEEKKMAGFEADPSRVANVIRKSNEIMKGLLPGMKIFEESRARFDFLYWKKSRKGLAALLRAEQAAKAAKDVA